MKISTISRSKQPYLYSSSTSTDSLVKGMSNFFANHLKKFSSYNSSSSKISRSLFKNENVHSSFNFTVSTLQLNFTTASHTFPSNIVSTLVLIILSLHASVDDVKAWDKILCLWNSSIFFNALLISKDSQLFVLFVCSAECKVRCKYSLSH